MDNFKKPKHTHNQRKTLDGFSPVSRSRFKSKHQFDRDYLPDTQTVNRRIDSVNENTEGFVSSQYDIEQIKRSSVNDDLQTNDLEVSLDEPSNDFMPPEQRRRGIFGRNKRAKTKRKPKFKLRLAKAAGVFVLLIILSFGSLFGYAYLKTRQIFRGNGEGAAALQENVTPETLNGEGDGRVNILLLGKGGPGHEAPDLTDTILLASIDPLESEAALVSVPRDLYVEDSGGGSTKINAIYSNAKQRTSSKLGDSEADMQKAEDDGLKAIKEKVSEVLGVPVHYYVMIDFTAFQEAIDTVGGITIDVQEPLYDYTMAWLNNGSPLIAAVGPQSFDGRRALMYARSRHGSARGDFDRTERQREVIVALQQKVLSLGTFSNPLRIVELLNTLGGNVRTDLNGTGELKRLYEIGKDISGDKVLSVGLADPPTILVSTDFINNQSVVVPVEGLDQYDDIRSYIRNIMRDPYLKLENARVTILNGTTTSGLATATEKELKSYGYNVIEIGNAPTSDYEVSQLIDVSGGTNKYTLSYLQKRLGINSLSPATEGLPSSEQTDFVIILGNDEITQTTNN